MIFNTGSWKTLAPANALILGLKELDQEAQGANYRITHRHIYFAHCYKNQSGWKELLQRFVLGNGTLYDMEFLTFVCLHVLSTFSGLRLILNWLLFGLCLIVYNLQENGVRVAAFGRCAGFTGMAVGIQNWCHQFKEMVHQRQHQTPKQELMPALDYWSDFQATTQEIQRNLEQVSELAARSHGVITRTKPKVMVLGALGR
jgi:hypothetical protein